MQTQQPDLVLLDISLPGISGVDVLEPLRQDPRFARLPVIMVAAVHHAVDSVTRLYDERQVTLTPDLAADEAWVVADVDRLQQVRINLRDNARKFAAETSPAPASANNERQPERVISRLQHQGQAVGYRINDLLGAGVDSAEGVSVG